tara:strand:+ start:300 stop:770 length:471 start_codon:yes stop_codon:yes gene_type:complete
MITEVRTRGDIDICVDYRCGKQELVFVHNTVLTTGRLALVNSLSNNIGDAYEFYITRMLFGDNGTLGGVKKVVDTARTGLFGATQLSKPALSNIDGSIPTQAIFTSVIAFDEVVGLTLNEMALQMKNGDLYSMTTFPDLNKTSDMQITFNWRLNFI